ncbi:hypothetical protein C9I57_30420 [Trinickia symbiotica]|uniref:Uncharacterized protein n=1 Tax=Trinickia symbiotica TaxID=863227 RepID=A0A2T3XKF7_9BURK|nr:hypothetical protein [Trinickia symbiotica]PTB17016.1 hypothetical protein C9I57_30420 [Trinickia symbiotica]
MTNPTKARRAREDWAARIVGYAARAHLLVAPSVVCGTAKTAARAALRAVYIGGPLTPTGYAILAVIVVAVALVAMLVATSTGSELDGALRLSWWF